jgi:hypothetical protein
MGHDSPNKNEQIHFDNPGVNGIIIRLEPCSGPNLPRFAPAGLRLPNKQTFSLNPLTSALPPRTHCKNSCESVNFRSNCQMLDNKKYA